MAHRVLGGGIHLAEGEAIALRYEDGIVAEAALAARREGERAIDAAFIGFALPVRSCQGENANEIGAAVGIAFELAFDARHGGGKIFSRPGPARRMDARRALQNRNA